MHCRQQVVAAFLQQSFVGDGAGGDDAHHLAFHRALRGGRIADLFTDGHGLAELHQFGEIVVQLVIGHARHGDGLAGRLAALGQGDVQQARRLAGVVVEEFVEIAHAVEHQHIRVLGLHAQVLAHDRRVFG